MKLVGERDVSLTRSMTFLCVRYRLGPETMKAWRIISGFFTGARRARQGKVIDIEGACRVATPQNNIAYLRGPVRRDDAVLLERGVRIGEVALEDTARRVSTSHIRR